MRNRTFLVSKYLPTNSLPVAKGKTETSVGKHGRAHLNQVIKVSQYEPHSLVKKQSEKRKVLINRGRQQETQILSVDKEQSGGTLLPT